MLSRVRTLLGLAPRVAEKPVRPLPVLPGELASIGMREHDWLAKQREGGRIYADISDRLLRDAAERYPARAAETVASADRVLRHEFSFLGSGPFVPTDPDRASSGYQNIDWNLDPIRRRRFPSGVPHKQWNLEAMRPAGADVKLPWELGRCQQLVPLGQAYRLTSNPQYALEVFSQVEDFAEANPTGIGVQWTCTMDVAIRAANWTIGLSLVRACDAIDEARWLNAYRLLFDHGVFIENNLENTYEVTSNHFLSNIVGLYFIGEVFAELPSGSRWRARCREWLEQEMRTQVLDDGADYESSIPYHRLVAELFLSAARLAAMRGEPLSGSFTSRLRAMCDYLADVLRPDGLMPQVGDADDGRLHVFSSYGTWQPQDARHLLAPAAAFFDIERWRALSGEDNGWEAAWWGFDVPVKAAAQSSGPTPLAHFPHAGVTVFQTPRTYVLVTNGVVGTAGFGNHKHNDQLSFEYHVDGVPLLVDPGTGVYTSDPAIRNRFRGTAFHNTVMIDGVEQNEIRFEWLFRMFETSRPEHLRANEDPTRLEYEGRHHGYERLPSPVVHHRQVMLDRASEHLRIVDTFAGSGRHALAWHFHCAPGVTADAGTAGVAIAAGTVRVRLSVPDDVRVTIEDAWYSPSYGVMLPTRAIVVQTEIELNRGAAFAFECAPE
jgi:hypothetical protein